MALNPDFARLERRILRRLGPYRFYFRKVGSLALAEEFLGRLVLRDELVPLLGKRLFRADVAVVIFQLSVVLGQRPPNHARRGEPLFLSFFLEFDSHFENFRAIVVFDLVFPHAQLVVKVKLLKLLNRRVR